MATSRAGCRWLAYPPRFHRSEPRPSLRLHGTRKFHGGGIGAGDRGGLHRRSDLRQRRRTAGAAWHRREGAACGVEVQLCARLRDASRPCARLGAVRAVGILVHARLALAPWRGVDLRQLALHAAGDPACQQAHRGNLAGCGQCRHPRSHSKVGQPPRRPQRAGACRHAGLSVGEHVKSGDLLFERRGAAGLITLNRPQALNAVSLAMVRELTRQLTEWEADRAVTRVIVTSNDVRAFSAGGDLRALYDLGRAGRYDEALGYFREEYALNTRIKRYSKPYVALIDGIVMGGGVGISVHGSHRVAGIATHRMASAQFPDLIEALCRGDPVDASLAAREQDAGGGSVAARRAVIEALFGADQVEDILAALEAEGAGRGPDAAFASATAALIRTKSPTSLKIALAQMQRGPALDFAECMRTEFRIVSRVVRGHDFYEGVRAVIIDKDQTPQWEPSRLKAVSTVDVERHFAPLSSELALP